MEEHEQESYTTDDIGHHFRFKACPLDLWMDK